MKRVLYIVVSVAAIFAATYVVINHFIEKYFHLRQEEIGNDMEAKRKQIVPRYQRGAVPELVQGSDLTHDAVVEYYEIVGSTAQDVWEGINRQGPSLLHGGWADTAYTAYWASGPPTDGKCGMTTAVVISTITLHFPHWQPPPDATDDARRAWDLEIRSLARHEQQHVDIVRQGFADGTAELRQADCTNADQVFARIYRRVQLQNLALDAGVHHFTVEQEEQRQQQRGG
jgi:predicted secreted Zn-dependent protease